MQSLENVFHFTDAKKRNYLEAFAQPVYHMPLYIIIKESSRFNRLL